MATLASEIVQPLVLRETPLDRVGRYAVRYGLVVVIVWFACMKFTDVEAQGIQPLVTHSPLLSWLNHLVSVRAFSRGLGVCELVIAILIALRPVSARLCVLGSVGAIAMFLTTLSFLLQPAAWNSMLGGFPVPSDPVGEFLVKDIVLLGVAVWSLSEAWRRVPAAAPQTA